jgi:hypothetical protein
MLQSDIHTVSGAVTRLSPLLTTPLQAQMAMAIATSTAAAPTLLNAAGSLAHQPSLLGTTNATLTNAMVSAARPIQTWHQPILPPGPLLTGMTVPGAMSTPSMSFLPTSKADQHEATTNVQPNGRTLVQALPISSNSFCIATNNATLATNTIHEITPAIVNPSPSSTTSHTQDELAPPSLSYQNPTAQPPQHQQLQLVQTVHSFSPVTTHYFVTHNTTPNNMCSTSDSTAVVPTELANPSRTQPRTTTQVDDKKVVHHATESHNTAMSRPIQQLREAYLKTLSTAPTKETPTGVVPALSNVETVSLEGLSWRHDEENLVSTTSATSASPSSRMSESSSQADMAPNVPTDGPYRLHSALVPAPSLQNAPVVLRAVHNGDGQPSKNVVHDSTSAPPPYPVIPTGILSSSYMPDFLSGFDKVVTQKQDTVTNAGIDLTEMHHDTPYSPTYTSKSFDELHCFLGQGLSPVPKVLLPAAQVGSDTTVHSSSFRKRQFHDITGREMSVPPTLSNVETSLRTKDDGTAKTNQHQVLSIGVREKKATEPPMLGTNFRVLQAVPNLKPQPVVTAGSSKHLPALPLSIDRSAVNPPINDNWSVPKYSVFDLRNSVYTKAKEQLEHTEREYYYRRRQEQPQDSSNEGVSLNSLCMFSSSPSPYHTTMGIFTSSSSRVATVSEPSNASDTTSEDANSGNEGGDSDGTQSEESFRGLKHARCSASNIEEIQEWVRQP